MGCRRYYKQMEIDQKSERQEALRRLDISDDSWPPAVILVETVAAVICWFTY